MSILSPLTYVIKSVKRFCPWSLILTIYPNLKAIHKIILEMLCIQGIKYNNFILIGPTATLKIEPQSPTKVDTSEMLSMVTIYLNWKAIEVPLEILGYQAQNANFHTLSPDVT